MLRTLGALELSGPGGNAVADLLSRPKPLGVLLYLALGEEAAAHRRDTLLALFWPDADAERARGSLRQTVYLLRRALGAPAIVGRGEEIGLAAHALHCDAADFRRRVALGDLAGALALYRGELLPGFFVEGAPGFDHWLEDQRRQLHHAATSAARSLAAAAERTGDDERGARLESTRGRARVRRRARGAPAHRPARAHGRPRGGATRIRRVRDAPARPARARALGGDERARRRVGRCAGTPRPRAGAAGGAARARRPFENETGVATLDPLGRLAADVVAQAIAQLDDVQVVPLTAALLSVRHVDAAAGDARGPARARLAAEETGAATVVGGAYYAAGDELVMQGWIGDVRDQRMLGALLPARAPLAAPFPAIESLRDQARTALALQLETRATHVRAAGRAPSYEAHGAYVEGITRFVDGDWRGALRHLERSAARDATYALPLLVSAIAHWNLGELEAADAVAGRAGAVMAGAGPFERALLDMVRAWLAGDWAAAYEAVRRQSELAPGTIASCQLAEEARRRNRPREALRLLAALDPTRGELRGWVFYWVVMAQALHMLGDHAQELVVARRARDLHPDAPLALRLEVQARAALGDVPGVRDCVEESLATPTRQEPRAGTLLREAALELRAHGGAGDATDAFLAQGLVWYEELPAEERALPAVRRATARARYDVGDWDGARAAFTALAGERVAPADCGAVHHPHLQAHLDHGYLGAIAVRLGDVAEADRIEALLASTRGAHLFGSTHYWRAAMAGLRGDGVAAARLLRRALAGGQPHEPFIHVDPHFTRVRGLPEFASVLAPRG
jgi:uncharacterized protein HemY